MPFYHIVIEILLILWIVRLLTRKPYNPKETLLKLTKEVLSACISVKLFFTFFIKHVFFLGGGGGGGWWGGGGGRGGWGGGESDLGPEIFTMHQPLITFLSQGFYFTMYTTSSVAQIYL